MSIKNYNIKMTDEDFLIIKYLREKECINISQFIRKCIKDKYEEIKNAKSKTEQKTSS